MFKIREVQKETFERVKNAILKLLKIHGNNRITHKALNWFSKLQQQDINDKILLVIAIKNNNLIGVCLFYEYGIKEAFITVHSNFRNKNIGKKLLEYCISRLPKIYTRIATDNIASLKLAFSCNLVAFDIFKGPTGKPTLILGAKDWSKDDVTKIKEE